MGCCCPDQSVKLSSWKKTAESPNSRSTCEDNLSVQESINDRISNIVKASEIEARKVFRCDNVVSCSANKSCDDNSSTLRPIHAGKYPITGKTECSATEDTYCAAMSACAFQGLAKSASSLCAKKCSEDETVSAPLNRCAKSNPLCKRCL